MKRSFFFLGSLALTSVLSAQEIASDYYLLCKRADSLYRAKDYKNSAFIYSAAFKSNGWKGLALDRYNAACSWALANYPDSSIFYLNRAIVGGYLNYDHISSDPDLVTLYSDKRWNSILEGVKANKAKAGANLNKPLAHKLDSILNEDQGGRSQIEGIEKKYGSESREMKALWKSIALKDSLNLIEAKRILDKYGWLGPDVVGQNGSSTLFLVIQHSDLTTQEKYLPMMREAVKKGKARASSLALLEDRVALRQGKEQIYGSQIGMHPETKVYYVLPLQDPENVDKRREEVGLPPLAEYVSHWGIKWDVKQYKKDLPEYKKLNKIK